MGIVSEIIPVFSRKHIFGYEFIALSSLAIALIGFLVWGHHIFVNGQSAELDAVFSFLTFVVAVPSAIKVWNWLATMYKGAIVLKTSTCPRCRHQTAAAACQNGGPNVLAPPVLRLGLSPMLQPCTLTFRNNQIQLSQKTYHTGATNIQPAMYGVG